MIQFTSNREIRLIHTELQTVQRTTGGSGSHLHLYIHTLGIGKFGKLRSVELAVNKGNLRHIISNPLEFMKSNILISLNDHFEYL